MRGRGALGLGVAIAVVWAGAASAGLPFKRLILENHFVRWISASSTTNLSIPTPTVITYAFATTNISFDGARNCRGVVPLDQLLKTSKLTAAAFLREARAAFGMWEAAANLRFVEVSDWQQAGIVIGAQREPVGIAFANVAPGSSESGTASITRASICLNPGQRWKIGFDGNLNSYDIRYVLAHEIGHTLGLDHPGSVGQLMSYKYDERFRQLQSGDVSGVVAIYGPSRKLSPLTMN